MSIKVQAVCEYLYHRRAWMTLTEVYFSLMDKSKRMEVSYRMEPIESIDTAYRFLIMKLTIGCKRLAYKNSRHQDKLGLVKILMLWHNIPLLLSES